MKKGKKGEKQLFRSQTLWVLQKDENQNIKISNATGNRCYRLNVKVWEFELDQNKTKRIKITYFMC